MPAGVSNTRWAGKPATARASSLSTITPTAALTTLNPRVLLPNPTQPESSTIGELVDELDREAAHGTARAGELDMGEL